MKSLAPYPLSRPRRLRNTNAVRQLVAENTISAADLIYPVFVMEGKKKKEAIASLPGQFRLSADELVESLNGLVKKGLKALALFPVVPTEKKSETASEAFNPEGLIPETVRLLKNHYPDLALITDIALDPYTSHGQDGLIDQEGYILNDETIDVLIKQALTHAAAGVDIVAPSDMMDGRIGSIRLALEECGHKNTKILSYAAKYASSFYGPFRDAVGSAANLGASSKETYQMDPANAQEALKEVALDLSEGADIVMVKPGLPYLDVVRLVKEEFKVPTFAYHVSGEYAMLKAAAEKGWLNYEKCLLETMMCFKRAGTDAVLTYAAPEVLELI